VLKLQFIRLKRNLYTSVDKERRRLLRTIRE